MAVDLVIIQKRLQKLEDYIKILREYQIVPLEKFKQDLQIHSTVERHFELAIECLLDIGNHIISAQSFRNPEDYRDIIAILGEENVIPSDFAKSFTPIASFLNILVHEYITLDLDIVYKYLQSNLDDFVKFTKSIIEYLDL
ncbi:MAG: DUF86 domain-containing protein [Candidatus Omnitrophica bacterium]|nr:DUF86 domain-containing protein [Candidatus Omnitrophota bacterium]